LINLTIKKLTKEASNEELKQLDLLIDENEEHLKTQEEIIRTWKAGSKAEGITNQETETEWKRLNKVIDEASKKKTTFSFYKIAAAITFIIVGSVTFYSLIHSAKTTILADNVQIEILKDGSTVTLNSNALLTYEKDFNQSDRELVLEGEAYFEVEKDDLKPFVIHAHEIDITVVGTSFNVKSNEGSETSEVVVNSGTVKMSSKSKSIMLTVGEKGVLIKKSGKLFKVQNDNPNFQAWKTRNFDFDDTPLMEVIKLLNGVYGKSLYIENNQLKKCPITVSFQDLPFESILKVLENTLDLTIEENNTGLLITGDSC
jgi:transmembrane sensor